MAVDALRMRTVDDVVLVFFEPEREPTAAELERCYAALRAEGITKAMLLSVGPMFTGPETRRDAVAFLESRGIRLVAVTDHRLNHGLLGLLSWLGVTSSAYPWSRLQDAARDVASRPELVPPIVRAARSLRAESPAAIGLDPDEG